MNTLNLSTIKKGIWKICYFRNPVKYAKKKCSNR